MVDQLSYNSIPFPPIQPTFFFLPISESSSSTTTNNNPTGALPCMYMCLFFSLSLSLFSPWFALEQSSIYKKNTHR